jgi:hypothetical protein
MNTYRDGINGGKQKERRKMREKEEADSPESPCPSFAQRPTRRTAAALGTWEKKGRRRRRRKDED